MRLTFYSEESIVLLFNKTNLSNTIFSFHSKIIFIFLLLVFSANISFGNTFTDNRQTSSYFSTQVQNYSKALLTEAIAELEACPKEINSSREWTALLQQFSSSPATINSRIASGLDDAEEDIAVDGINEGFVDVGNADLELGIESEAQLVGLRFTNIAIPKGARIVSAYVEFEGDEAGTDITDLTIYGEAADDANTFSTTTKDISNRTKTAALVTWNKLPTWSVDSKYKTTNIASIIQEIVDRNGWISGNDLAIMIEGTGKRTAESYDGEATAAPLLVVTYDDTPVTANLIRTYQQNDNSSEFFSYDPDPTCSSADWEADWIKFNCPDGFQIDEYDDGSLIMSGTIVNIVDNCDRWDVYMRLENKRNWTDWTALGRMFYEASGGGACNDNRFDWGFYEIDANASRWTGSEGYCNETKEVFLVHSPSDYSKGVQVGFGANNCGSCDCQTNDIRGWMSLTGDLNLPCSDFGLNINGYEVGNSCSVTNGGFEDDLDYWYTDDSNVNITNDAYVGSKAVIISGDDESIGKSWLPATPGKFYLLSAWGKITDNPKWAGMNLKFYDKDRNQLGNSSTDITSTSWSNIQVGSIAPAGAYFLNIGLYKDVDGGTLTFDEVCLEILEEYTESACETINNPNFETDIATDWSTWGTSTISQSTDSFEGTYAAEIGGGTEGGLSQEFNVIAGERYSFSAYIKQIGSIDWAGMGITWKDAGGSDISAVNTIDFTSTYTLKNIFAKAPTGAVTARIWVSKYGPDEVYVDGFCWKTVAERPSCDNLLTNHEFDNGTNDWQLDVDGSTAASATWNVDNSNQLSGANSVFVNVTNATSSPWNIQLLQENKSIVAGKEYQVVFEAKATAARDMVVAVQENSGAWDSYGSQTVNLTTEPQTYSFKFIAPVTNIGGIALIFHLAKSTDNVFIDNVRFSEACVTEICDNNIDDDGDGLIDGEDTDCSNSIACVSCTGPNLFDNPSFENGTWTGSEIFVAGVFATDITSPSPLDSWGYGESKWVESNKATDGNRFIYLNTAADEPVCYSQRYTFGDGNDINDCDTYQVCFDWASFNSDYVNGRTTASQPSIDFIFRDNAEQNIKFVGIPIGDITANQNWNSLTWESLSFSFKLEGNLTVPANTAYIDVLISERDGYDNGFLLDNTSFCVVNSCSDDCSVTNMYPGFTIDAANDNCSWIDYTLDSDLNFTNNGDGTAIISGTIIDGIDADWDACATAPCGANDDWFLTLNLSNKQNWTDLQAAGGTANVHTNCDENNLDYWDVSGTLTGLGCNSGRTLTINSASGNYRLQIGYGGNNNDSNCDFGLSTWFDIEESGSPIKADIYGFLDASCYEEDVCTCSDTNLFDNAGFELGTFTGADEFLPSVQSDYLGWNWGTPTVLDGWSHGALHWIESPNSKEGDRMVYINNPSGGAVCQGQYYNIGSGLGQLAECATYQMCFDWASFNRENPTGRDITSQPAIDFVWFDAAGNDLGVKHQILSVPVANQDWDNLIWSSVSFSFSLTEMYAPPANATRVRINISEHNGEDNGMLIDNANLCEIMPCSEENNCGNLQFDNVVVSNCIDHPLMDVATLDVAISWDNAPANDSIEVKIANQTEYIDVAGGVTSPQTVQFIIPADGSTNNEVSVNWKNDTPCLTTATYDAPTACSNNEIACEILYICGDDKPENGDAWDHGWLEYLDAVNGSSGVTPTFSKADASGMGLYDPNNTANALAINFTDYDLIIVSATTEARLSDDIITALKNTTTSVLNSNYTIVNDLGMASVEAGYDWQDIAYPDNTTSSLIYNFNNKIDAWGGKVMLNGNYNANANALLWQGAGDANAGIDGILFNYTSDDALPSIPASHGNRTFLGYHMNGFYANDENNGVVPTPQSAWFEPAKHLTLVGKTYLDSALVLAAADCGTTTSPNKDVCYLISDGAGDGYLTADTFYTFNHTTGAVFAVGETGTLNIEAMAYDTVNQIIYAADGNDFGTINIETGVFTAITTNMGSLDGVEGNNNISDIDGMTYDYANNIVWATERSSGMDGLPDDILLKIDPITGMPLTNGFGAGIGYVTVVTNEHDLDDIAMAAAGTLYAISNFGGSGNQRLGTINTTTGIFTEIGDYGIQDVESLTFTATGQLLATTGEDGNHKNSLYSIDAATAIATFIGSIEPGHDVEACDCSFGNLSNLQIGDKVWADLNNDGLQDIDEPGLKDIKVNLLDENGNVVLDNSNNPKTTTTDVYGIYNFSGLAAGNYIIEFELPTGTSFATKDIGGDDTKDSDADGTTGRTGIITLAGSINNLDADAGILNANVVIRDCTNDGELFVLDENAGVLLRYNPNTGALIDTFIHGFIQPMEMVVGDDNYLYISDRGFQQIRRYSLITGAFIDILARNLNSPIGMTFGSDGMLYVNTKNRDEVLKIDPTDGTTTVFIANQLGGLDGNYGGIEFGPDGSLYVTSRNTDEVLRYNGTTGAFIDAFVSAGSGSLNGPDNLTFESDGNLYVTSSYSDQVKRYNGTTGAFIDDFVAYQSGGLNRPLNAVFGSDGNVYVSGQDSPAGIYRYNESTGAFVDLFATGLDGPRGILFAPVPDCDNSTCCSQISYQNTSLEEGNFSSFTSPFNPKGTGTLTTFGGSSAVEWAPTDGYGVNGSPITGFGANPGYWVDASTNGGLGSLDGNRFYWLEPRAAANGSDCIGATEGADLLGAFCVGDTVEFCAYIAAYDPLNINDNTVNTDFIFEIHSDNGADPADFITTPIGTSSIDDNGDNKETFTFPLPATTNLLDITGNPFTGANGQIADWRTLNWQQVCFQVVLKQAQSDYSSIAMSMTDGSDGMAIDNLSIRDITTPNAGTDTTIYTCSPRLNLTAAQSGETWSKVIEPAGATATIDASTGVITGLTENGIYKFLLSKTDEVTCHDTIKVLVNCMAEICDDGIDNDGDGLTDCEDPDCNSITISELSFSECVLTGTEYQATMTIEVSWTNPPAGEGINVTTPYNSQFIDIVGGATSPTAIQFVVAADNSTNLLSLAYSGGSGCGFDSYYDAPAPCPPPTERNMPCTNGSGYVGGVVFEDLSGDGLQDGGEPGLEGIMVTATDSVGLTVGQTLTNNIGVFEFADLTDGGKFKIEFTAIPSGMYPTNGSTYKGTTVQYVDAPSCATTLGLFNPTENPCEATDNAILQNGYSVVACLPAGDDVTLAVKDVTQLGTLWQTPANRNTNQYDNVPTIRMWDTSDFEGSEIFSMAIDPRDGTIYAVASPLYGDGSNVASVLFEENIAPKVFKINPETGVVTRIAELSGTLGLGAIDFDVINEQLLITNMDDGKIYRLNTDGVVLNSFDPMTVDDGINSQLPTLGDRILGIAFNPIDKRVYYSVWSNHSTFITDYQNINNDYNTIRSIALDANGDFINATDQLEITVPYNAGSSVTVTMPTADISFNRTGDRVLLAEFSVNENNSNGQLSTSAHTSVVREYQNNGGTWTLEPTYGSNNQGKYDIGSLTSYQGRNSRGGVDWAYERVSGDTIFGNEDFILATGDALHVTSHEGDFIYGYQFTPATGGNIANSILVDLDDDLVNADKYVYSDVDIYKDYCATLNLEIGNYVWLDSNEDGIQDLYEVGLSGINVTLFSAAGDSLTTVVTDADGAYYFSQNTTGLTPNTTYYIVVGRGGQFNTETGALNFVFDLTIPNIGNGNYTDENDSDGVIGDPSYGHPVNIADYPTIELVTGENGQNDYSFDFGFKEVCTAAVAVNDSIPTCPGVAYEGSVSLNDSNYENKRYSVVSNPSRGTVTMETNGTFTYVGNTATCISDEFVYQVCDASNICCATARVYLDFADAIKPTLQNIPADDTISCDEVVPLPPQIFAIDNCPRISLDVKEVDTQGEDGCSLYDYTITRTWTAIDQCGNSTSASQMIEVQDFVAPDIYRVYTLPNGKKMVAGVMELVGKNWKTVSLPIDFDTKPIILHQVTTNDGLTPVVAQIQNISVSQFELRIAAEEANTTRLTRESVSWIAMEAGTQSTDYQLEMNSLLLSDVPQIVNFQNSFTAIPALFTSAQTTNEEDPATVRHDALATSGMALMMQEEASNDAELAHINERVGYLALEKIGDLRDQKGILLGEVGTTTMNSGWATITLNNTYANPVIIANGLSSNDGEAATVRIQNVGLNSFDVSVDEWAYLDGNHGNETISYMVVEGSIPLESPTYCDNGTDSLDIGIDFKAVDNCDVSVIINYTERDSFVGATKIITRTWAAEDECGNSTSYSQQISCQGVSLQLKSILQGAMLNNTGDGLMRDDLRLKGILPMQEPYSQMPFFEHVNTGGGEVMDADLLTVDGANGIVDWVFVELRDANDMDNVVATRSALIQCDGDVVTVKGDSIIHFTNTRIGDYFVSLRHRNHLGMITLYTESFTPSTIPFVDFTFVFTAVVGSNSSIKIDNLESLWSGDLNGDGKVIYQGPNNDIFYMFLHVLQDKGNKDFLPNFISNDYTNDDFNLDGSVIYQGPNNDRAQLLFNTILRHPDNPQKFSNFIIYRGEGN